MTEGILNQTDQPIAAEDTTTIEQESLVPYPVINTVDNQVDVFDFEVKSISEINTDTVTGRLLMAALAKLTVESQRDKQPDEVLEQCNILALKMYEDKHRIRLHSMQ